MATSFTAPLSPDKSDSDMDIDQPEFPQSSTGSSNNTILHHPNSDDESDVVPVMNIIVTTTESNSSLDSEVERAMDAIIDIQKIYIGILLASLHNPSFNLANFD